MGLLVDGRWVERPDKSDSGGRFDRQESAFRNWITPDGSPGPSGEGGFRAAPERYHLYVSYACPWAHRTLIYRALKGLEGMIGLSVVHWFLGERGWSFAATDADDEKSVVGDRLLGKDHLHEIYTEARPDATTRVTVPVLWDAERGTIVSNESSEIIRMFNSAFDALGAREGDYYPEAKREAIERINERVYDTLNNGVYKCGFATTQAAYDEAVVPLFETLEWLEDILAERRFLCGDAPLEADWRLLTTLLRFDLVYHGHFKCNRRRIVDYPNLRGYTRDLYQWPGIADTCRFDHIARHYHRSHESVNPHRIVPIGPELDFDAPHDRVRLGG